MQALILAAGWATRMGALAGERPKHLLPIGGDGPRGTVALDFAVRSAVRTRAVSAVHVLVNDRFAGTFEGWQRERRFEKPLRLWRNGVARFEERRGAVGDIGHFLTRSELDDDLLVVGGDNVCDFDLDPMAEVAHREPVVALYDVGSPERVSHYASAELDDEGRVSRLVEKDPSPRTRLAAVAIYGLPRASLPDVERYLTEGHPPDNLGFFAEWLVENRVLRGEIMRGRWIDVGSPDEYERARREFGRRPAARDLPSAHRR